MPSTTSLVTATKGSDPGLRALLHPLILLTISDYITRHTLRQQSQPIVGAIIGQQNGREVSLEHAYDVKPLRSQDGKGWILDNVWFSERLQQYRDVHKAPTQLELVGWWTTCPESGPGWEVLAIHEAIMAGYNESALLLAFHPATVLGGNAVGGKLPLTIYESLYESTRTDSARDMQIDGEELKEGLELKFRELPYEVATGEAEMISVDFVARGGGSATAVDGNVKKNKVPPSQSALSERSNMNGKGKEKAVEPTAARSEDLSGLTAEEEELIASLTTRANAVKMLQSRISLLSTYLSQLPPSYLNTPPNSDSNPTPTPPPTNPDPNAHAPTSHPLLRSILALTSRLPLVVPADAASFQRESRAERSDVSLVALLGSLGRNIKGAKELGAKFAVVEPARVGGKRSIAFGGPVLGRGVGEEEFEGRVEGLGGEGMRSW